MYVDHTPPRKYETNLTEGDLGWLEKSCAAFVLLAIREHPEPTKAAICGMGDASNEKTKFIRIREAIELGLVTYDKRRGKHNAGILTLTPKGAAVERHLEVIRGFMTRKTREGAMYNTGFMPAYINAIECALLSGLNPEPLAIILGEILAAWGVDPEITGKLVRAFQPNVVKTKSIPNTATINPGSEFTAEEVRRLKDLLERQTILFDALEKLPRDEPVPFNEAKQTPEE